MSEKKKAKRRRWRTMYAQPLDGPAVAVRPIETYVSYGEELIAAVVTARGHERYAKGALIIVGTDRITYKTRSGNFIEVPRKEIERRIEG